jgi:integrase/recombinase XerD
MEKALQRYVRWHRSSGHTAKTIRCHTQTIQLFVRFLKANNLPTTVEELHVDYVREWLDEQRDRGLSDYTLATRVRSLRAFTNWLVQEEWLDRDPLLRLKVPKVEDKPKEVLTPEQVDKLLATCDRDTANGLRDIAIMILLYSTGLRATELASLRVDDVDYERGLVIVRRGKGGKYRVVPLGNKADRAISRYLSKRPQGEDDPRLFLTDKGRSITYVTLRQMLRRRGDKAGIHANPHLFRHSFAVQYLRNGGKLETLKAIMGHTTFEVTLHYARLAGVDISTAHDTADPARSLKSK